MCEQCLPGSPLSSSLHKTLGTRLIYVYGYSLTLWQPTENIQLKCCKKFWFLASNKKPELLQLHVCWRKASVCSEMLSCSLFLLQVLLMGVVLSCSQTLSTFWVWQATSRMPRRSSPPCRRIYPLTPTYQLTSSLLLQGYSELRVSVCHVPFLFYGHSMVWPVFKKQCGMKV